MNGNTSAGPSSQGSATAFQKSTRAIGKALPFLGVPLAAVLAIMAAERWYSSEPEFAILAVSLPDPGYGPANYRALLAAADRQMTLGRERVAGGPDEWLRHESLARAQLARFKLTASSQELASAFESLATARHLAPAGSGPMLSSAELAMAMHDLDEAEEHLAALDRVAVPPEPAARAEALGLRGDIAFYRGEMGEAHAFYDRADTILPTAGNAIRRAILLRGEGRFDEAIAQVGEAARRGTMQTPRGMASYAMQIGMIESARGNYPEAREWFVRADELFPGDWLTALYIAEADAIAGEVPRAIATMERIARETGDPQAMDAAAFLHLDSGDEAASREWSSRAAQSWRERAELMPSAYIAHAFENELAFGNPAQALAQARRNAASRPYGDALILVAEALLATGRPEAAREQLLAAERTGWRSAPLYATLSEAEHAFGNHQASEAAAKKARELNPHIFEPLMDRLWFGHG